MHSKLVPAALALVMSVGMAAIAEASPDEDRKAVAALDTKFQAAVKRHDVATIDRILHDEMTLVLGDGRVVTREDHLKAAREKSIQYEIQDEDPGTQFVRVFGDTAVVTARLWIKGVMNGAPFERRLWFSDTYVRTPKGWKYFFGQASLKLPD
ncbi:MAG: nuclear transport factor 2 family protein [Steroidobacteraceae bacterium]